MRLVGSRGQQTDLSYIGLGANLDHPHFGSPRQTLAAAVAALQAHGLTIVAQSSWYESAPVPIADQPWYVNAVVAVRSDLPAPTLLQQLHAVEAEFGRVRSVVNAPRVVDLDLLDCRGEQFSVAAAAESDLQAAAGQIGAATSLILPHPRMAERAFVLLPLQEITPNWRHPVSGETVEQMLAALGEDRATRLDP